MKETERELSLNIAILYNILTIFVFCTTYFQLYQVVSISWDLEMADMCQQDSGPSVKKYF